MIYIEESDLEIIFSIIDKFYSRREEVPNYRNDKHGLSQLIGVLERVKMDYYPLLEDKVSYLFIQVNKGHFFSNGNKRLALVLAVGFLLFNDKDINNYSIEQSWDFLRTLFPNCEHSLENYPEFTGRDYLLYNLSIIVADSNKYIAEGESFDSFKNIVTQFFKVHMVEYKQNN